MQGLMGNRGVSPVDAFDITLLHFLGDVSRPAWVRRLDDDVVSAELGFEPVGSEYPSAVGRLALIAVFEITASQVAR